MSAVLPHVSGVDTEHGATDNKSVFDGLVRQEKILLQAANDSQASEEDESEDELTGQPAQADNARAHTTYAKTLLCGVIGKRLIRARALTGLTQTEAAALMGYQTPAQLNLWEMGRRLIPMIELVKVAPIYGVSIDFLVSATDEPDRDPSMALRHACLRGVREQLSRVAEVTVDALARHTRLIGPHAGNVRTLLSAGENVTDALGSFMRANGGAFANQKGSARLVRVSEEFEAALLEARTAIRLHDARDKDLQAALASLATADDVGSDRDANN